MRLLWASRHWLGREQLKVQMLIRQPGTTAAHKVLCGGHSRGERGEKHARGSLT